MFSGSIDSLVLRTVNASWKRIIPVEHLATAVTTADREWLPHLMTFFGEVKGELVLAFAERHGISSRTLKQTYYAVKEQSNINNPELEAYFGWLEDVAHSGNATH